MTLWRDFQESLAAYWLRAGKGGFWLRAIGSMKDQLEHVLREGVLARWLQLYVPGSTYDDFARSRASYERQMDQLPGELATAHVARIRASFDEWSRAGTALKLASLLRQWQDSGYGFAGTYVVESNGRWWDDSGVVLESIALGWGPSQWGNLDEWNACAAVFVSNTTAAGPGWPDVGNDSLRSLVKTWKPGHVRFSRFIVVQLDTDCWGGLVDWLTPGPRLTWGGSDSPATPGGLKWGANGAASVPEFWTGVTE